MIYMAGDNDLEDYVAKDIETELALLGSNRDVQIIIFADQPKGTLLFRATQGMKAIEQNAIANLHHQNTGDPKTLAHFVQWTKANYPADHYLLSFWGHGFGPGNWLMYDQSTHDRLELSDLATIMPSIGFIDVVAYDTCQMASLETAALWHNHATALSFSQEAVGGNGIGYDLVIKALQEDPGISPDNIAREITHSAKKGKEETWSAIAVDSRLDPFLSAFQEWSSALTKKDLSALKSAQTINEDPLVKDLYDAVLKTNNTASKKLLSTYHAIVIDEYHLPKYKAAHGLNISISELPTKF
jgi:hypothetical protein